MDRSDKIRELDIWADQNLVHIQHAMREYDREDKNAFFSTIYHLHMLNDMNIEDHDEYIINNMGSEDEFNEDIEKFIVLKNKIEGDQGPIGGRRRLRKHKTRRAHKTKKARKNHRSTRTH
jgi:chromatin remodeling complex protein RSC6